MFVRSTHSTFLHITFYNFQFVYLFQYVRRTAPMPNENRAVLGVNQHERRLAAQLRCGTRHFGQMGFVFIRPMNHEQAPSICYENQGSSC